MTDVGLEKDYSTYPWPKFREAHTRRNRLRRATDNEVDAVAEATNSSNKYKEAVGTR